MKTCGKCGLNYEGRRCKPCWNAYMRARNAKHRAEIREHFKNWYAVNGRARNEEYTKVARQWRLKNQQATSAHTKVRAAIVKGTLIKPTKCDKCNRDGVRLSAHHKDYNKPLVVAWLCGSCHKLEHKEVSHVK